MLGFGIGLTLPLWLCAAQAPNVILIMTDDQGYGDMSCHGNPYIETPHLDKLHSESVRLTNFHVSPTCAPTRAALMTGRDTNKTGAWHTINGRNLMFLDEVTMAEVFAANGYRTGIFGKWHLGSTYPFRPQDRGFQDVFIYSGGGLGTVDDYWNNDGFDDHYLNEAGFHVGREGYGTDVIFDEAIAFIEENRNRPFFCHVPTRTPHGPYVVPESYSKPFERFPVNPHYYGMLKNIDDNIGRLLAAVDHAGLREDTLVIFCTDNGRSTWKRPDDYNAGMRGTKGSRYEGGHRVPCFARWPARIRKTAGKDISALTAHIDWLPTLAKLCGLQFPEDILELDGRDISPLLLEGAAPWADRTVVVDGQRVITPIKWRNCAVMTERWRLINGEELYAIREDPGQEHDVAGLYPEVVESLRETYEAWWRESLPRRDKVPHYILDADMPEELTLTSEEWFRPDDGVMVWHQRNVRAGAVTNGVFHLDVREAGRYRFGLRRWPREVEGPMRQPLPMLMPESDCCGEVGPGVALNIRRAELRIGDIFRSRPVASDASEIRFDISLKEGKWEMQSALIDDKGVERGAYYVYLSRI